MISGNAEIEQHLLTNAINFGSAASQGFPDAVGDGLQAKPGELLTLQNSRIVDHSFTNGHAVSNIEASQGQGGCYLTVTPPESTTAKEPNLASEPYRDFTEATH